MRGTSTDLVKYLIKHIDNLGREENKSILFDLKKRVPIVVSNDKWDKYFKKWYF